MKELNEKVVIVTGAGSGIGKAISQLFSRNGAHVVLIDIKQENIEEVAKEITKVNGKASCFATDISKSTDVDKMFNYVLDVCGKVDILVNNAGIMDDFYSAGELELKLWKKVMATNLDGTFFCCRAAIKLFLEQSAGNIINISSVAGLFGSRAGLAYTVSKHALIGLTKNIGYQYAPKGIRCNAIAPGGVNTNILINSKPDPFGLDRMQAGTANIPPSAEPEQIAEVALFLASERSSYINGSVVVADGGWTAY